MKLKLSPITPLAIAIATFTCLNTSASAAAISVGTVFGLDFGPTATDGAGNDWVDVAGTAASSLLAGDVHDLSNVTVDGVSVAFSASGGIFSNDDGPNANYAALQPTTVLNPNFVESVMTDIAGTSGAAATYTVSIAGLDIGLQYDVVATSAAFASGGQTETLTINGGPFSSITRGSPTSQTYHSFSGVPSNAGVLDLVFTQSADNPIVNGILITAVPEPSSAAFLGLASLGLILRRRRK